MCPGIKEDFLTLLISPWEFFLALLSSADFFQNQLFRKILSGIPTECQTDWIQIRPDNFVGLDLNPIFLQRLLADDTRR